ncbi:hypothetical protein [Flagellimonas meishanensis]|uniref:hypothetical protein n=1 Tax=Flagellimonas meishanensis TaxID=2873264 RepID=UPI001CA6373C|nr:hypothetical protein [[Muricauda] meishanensis]
MKMILKITGLFIGILLLSGVVWGFLAHEPLPSGATGSEADALAQKMLDALDHEKYADTRFLHWSYRAGANEYEWDRAKGVCLVKWDDNEVHLDLTNASASEVKVNGLSVTATEQMELVQDAVKMFNNDSFWLVAPYKVFDVGTQRSIVALEDGAKGLMVTYTSGGSTPGDSYLWLLEDNGRPYAFKMWVKIIPVGGVRASWSDWVTTSSGAQLPKSHKIGPITLSMGDVKGFNP